MGECTAVYGSPIPNKRTELWESLRKLKAGVSAPWALIGDFNALLHADEKRGGVRFCSSSHNAFVRVVEDCEFLDIGFEGPRFTWFRRDVGERLDRALCNKEWQLQFDEGFLTHLPRIKSDHRPILLSYFRTVAAPSVHRPFRFQAAWLTHPSFKEFIKDSWLGSGAWELSYPHLVEALKKWNFEVFGNIFHRKNRVLQRMKGVENILSRRYSTHLRDVLGGLQKEFEEILIQEELLWYQKSRINWLGYGDRNTSFFHTTTRRKNRISMLQHEDGSWVTVDADLQRMTRDFFKNLYTDEQSPSYSYQCRVNFPALAAVSDPQLTALPTKEEIFGVVKNFGGFKSPGIDGFPPLFFQSQWAIVGDSISDFVRRFFREGELEAAVNETLIVLIQKIPNPINITQFRPISLCNVSYKIITKLIANRIKPLMGDLVKETQSGFIQGREISDNVVIVQEVIHSMRHKTGKQGWMAIKIDLEKAYDRLRWAFIEETLTLAGFPRLLTEQIMTCVTTVSMRVLWNGVVTDSFLPTRGIRQGDPLSPYLFVLCMERLGHLIEDAVEEGVWQPIQIGNSGPRISHMFFADDFFLFSTASKNQGRVIQNILDTFCKISGQKVSQPKSKVYFSKNTSAALQGEISRLLDFSVTQNLGVYLGVPILHGRLTKSYFSKLVEKIRGKLSSWKVGTLSFAGRVTLAKSVLQSIPNYLMQTTLIPSGVTKEIDQITRNLIWGSNADRRRLHLLNWDRVCAPKKKGGLGLSSTSETNRALILKLGWRFLNNQDRLWAKVLAGKYGWFASSRVFTLDNVPSKKNCSTIWRALCGIWPLLAKAVVWHVSNGESARFWEDVWIEEAGPLLCAAHEPIPEELRGKPISYFVTVQGRWDWSLFQRYLPAYACILLAQIPPPTYTQERDSLRWKLTLNGQFDLASARTLFRDENDVEVHGIGKLVWKWKGPQRIRSFLWLLAHDRLPTRVLCARRHIIPSDECPHCKSSPESALHVLRDCFFSNHVWRQLIPESLVNVFFMQNMEDWLRSNLRSHETCGNLEWPLVFGTALWYLWGWRNELVFEGKINVSPNPALQVMERATEFDLAERSLSQVQSRSVGRVSKWVRWIPPLAGWIKLNCDGGYDSRLKLASAGGVLRNSTGAWIMGFSQTLDICSAWEAEVWAVHTGLSLALSTGVVKLHLESDSWEVIQALQLRELKPPWCSQLIQCRLLLNRFHEVTLDHIFREANQVADGLAKMAHSFSLGTQMFPSPPPCLQQLLNSDISGSCLFRPGC